MNLSFSHRGKPPPARLIGANSIYKVYSSWLDFGLVHRQIAAVCHHMQCKSQQGVQSFVIIV